MSCLSNIKGCPPKGLPAHLAPLLGKLQYDPREISSSLHDVAIRVQGQGRGHCQSGYVTQNLTPKNSPSPPHPHSVNGITCRRLFHTCRNAIMAIQCLVNAWNSCM